MRILDEIQHAKKMIESGFQLKQYQFELKILAKYLYNQDENLLELRVKLIKFCNKHLEGFNEIKYINMINRCCSYAEKNTLFKLSSVGITENELQTIKDLNDLRLEKIAFILLVISKMNRQSYLHYINDKINYTTTLNEGKKKKLTVPEIHEGYYADGKINSFFKSAKIHLKKKDRSSTIKELIDIGIIAMTQNCKYKINFIDEESDVVLNIANFNNIILEYMRYIGDNIGDCEVCGGLFEIRSNRHKTCRVCWNEYRRKYKTNKQKQYRNVDT